MLMINPNNAHTVRNDSNTQVEWQELPCWKEVECRRRNQPVVNGKPVNMDGEPSVESIMQRLRDSDQTVGPSDVEKMAPGMWLNDSVVNTLVEGVYYYSRAHNSMVVIDSQVAGKITRGDQLQRLLHRMKLPASVGVLNVRNNTHWVAYQLTCGRKEVTPSGHLVASSKSVAEVFMLVLDPLISSDVQYQEFYSWSVEKGLVSLLRKPGVGRSFMPHLLALEALVAWHCRAWHTTMPLVHEWSVTVRLCGTGQQQDSWACGRWAVANVAALIASHMKQCSTLPMPTSYDLVEQWLFRLLELITCGPALACLNPMRKEFIEID